MELRAVAYREEGFRPDNLYHLFGFIREEFAKLYPEQPIFIRISSPLEFQKKYDFTVIHFGEPSREVMTFFTGPRGVPDIWCFRPLEKFTIEEAFELLGIENFNFKVICEAPDHSILEVRHDRCYECGEQHVFFYSPDELLSQYFNRVLPGYSEAKVSTKRDDHDRLSSIVDDQINGIHDTDIIYSQEQLAL